MKDVQTDEFHTSLLAALKFNSEHARHQEIQRQYQLYVFMVVFAAVIAFVFDKHKTWHLTLQQFWPVFGFLTVYSLFLGMSVTKWNIEFRNSVRNIQWISERLRLINSVSINRKSQVIQSNLKPDEK